MSVERTNLDKVNFEIPVDINILILFVKTLNVKMSFVKEDTLRNAIILKDSQDVNSESFVNIVMLLFMKTMRRKSRSWSWK